MSLYTLLKSAVSRPVEINFTEGEPVRFKPYESLYVSEERLANDSVATSQLKEYLDSTVLRCLGMHLVPTEVMSIDEVIDEIINARESSTRGVRFFSIDDRMEAMENDLLDVVTVSDLPEDEFNTPSDVMYNAIMNELIEARKNQKGDYSYGSLKERLDALCDAIDRVDYRNVDVNTLLALPEQVRNLSNQVEELTRRLQGGSLL